MSYSLRIEDSNGNIMQAPFLIFPQGANCPIDGTRELETSITYNYWMQFRKAFNTEEGIYTLNGVPCLDSIPIIRNAMDRLDNDVDENDYWAATDGNAKRALAELLHLAALGCIDGFWRVS